MMLSRYSLGRACPVSAQVTSSMRTSFTTTAARSQPCAMVIDTRTFTFFQTSVQNDSVGRQVAYATPAAATSPFSNLNSTLQSTSWRDLLLSQRHYITAQWGWLRVSRNMDKSSSNNNSNNNNNGGNNNNNNNNDETEANDDGDDDEEGPEKWLVPRTCLFVLMVFLVTLILYHLQKPVGRHVGWATVKSRAQDIISVNIYEHYAQIYLRRHDTDDDHQQQEAAGDGKDSGTGTTADDVKLYVGLLHDHDTQKNMDVVADLYREAQAEHKKQWEKEEEAIQRARAKYEKRKLDQEKNKKPGEQQQQQQPQEAKEPILVPAPAHAKPLMPEDITVNLKGTPVAESALVVIGYVAWIAPFIFFPVFVSILSRFIFKTTSAAVDATKGKGATKASEMVFKVENSSSTRFRDIAGMKEPKKEITEIVDFLRNPQRYTALGAKIPTGALLLGPPGTGKTLLAKAVSGESGVAFIPVCGSDFVELYVGMGALRVRQLFKEAHKQRCIIYIDEIDAIGLKRGGKGDGESQEQERTLNELLTQLDGFSSSKRGDVLVIASSNVEQGQLDPALVRPGRFDRIVHVDAPVLTERIDIFKVHLCKLKLLPEPETKTKTTTPTKDKKKTAIKIKSDKSTKKEEKQEKKEEKPKPVVETPVTNTTEKGIILSELEAHKQKDADQLQADREAVALDLQSLLMTKSDEERILIEQYAKRMSDLCPGFVGSDIANVCNEAAILAAREDASCVNIHHLERSIDRVLAGIEQRSRVLSDFEKNVVAHHEAGHAVAGWFLNRADPLMKVSIVPRGGSALGYAQYLPNENYTRTAHELRDAMKVSLGGRVAEQIFFQHLSTGASDDLRKVGKMAYQYVSSFASHSGAVYPAPGTSSTRYVKPFGERKSNKFDEDVKRLVDEVYEETLTLLTHHKDDMKRLADHLLKHEILTFQDVVSYLGSRSSRESDKRKGV